MIPRVNALSLSLALSLFSLAPAVRAQPAQPAQPAQSFAQTEARTHFQTGARHYQEGQFTQAIEEFETAFRLFPSPVILFNLAQAYRSDGRLSEAVATFRRFLESAERITPEQRHDVETTIDEIEASRASLTFEIEPAGATLSIDGRQIGTLPLTRPLELTPGEHQVEISLANYQTRRDEVTLTAHQRRLYNATLLPVALNARLSISTTPPDATLTLDGAEIPQSQTPQPVAPGEHSLTVSRDGYLPQTRTVRVNALGSESVSVTLDRTRRSVFTRPLFWAIVGGVVVVTVGAILLANPPDPTPINGNTTPSVAQTVFSF